jgi:cytochrome c oxidase subunit 4
MHAREAKDHAMKAHTPPPFDPLDPHHFSDLGEHHGHHITHWRTLLGVLVALLLCTGLTVFAAQFETYLIQDMGWSLPNWVNIAIAMSIATVKALMVIAVFMALKYENPLYTIVFLFCIFAFGLFLGFTGMDLDNRGYVYDWKVHSISEGGLGASVTHPPSTIRVLGESIEFHEQDAQGNKKGFSFSGSLAAELKRRYIAATGITEEEYWRRWAEANHVHAHEEHLLSTAQRSIPRTGLSGALDEHAPAHGDHAPASDGHGPSHQEAAPASH